MFAVKKGSFFVLTTSYNNNENTFAIIDNALTLGLQNSVNFLKEKGRYMCFLNLYDRDIHAQIDRLSKSRQWKLMVCRRGWRRT